MDGFSSMQLYKTDPSVSQNSQISSLKLSRISMRELADLAPYESRIFWRHTVFVSKLINKFTANTVECFLNARMPDCPASGQSDTRMNEILL